VFDRDYCLVRITHNLLSINVTKWILKIKLILNLSQFVLTIQQDKVYLFFIKKKFFKNEHVIMFELREAYRDGVSLIFKKYLFIPLLIIS
jgi:hypothetical protein